MEWITKFKQQMKLKKLLKQDTEALIAKAEYILSLCVNVPVENQELEKLIGFRLIDHHLPYKKSDRDPLEYAWHESEFWDITDEQKEIVKSYIADLSKYASLAVDCYSYTRNNKRLIPIVELLPLWFVFPIYPATTIGWRMGLGELYEDCYQTMLLSMDDKTRQEYIKKFPAPAYMEERSMYSVDFSEWKQVN